MLMNKKKDLIEEKNDLNYQPDGSLSMDIVKQSPA